MQDRSIPGAQEMREAISDEGSGHRSTRFTQDSPILPDLWMAFAEDPDEPQDMLINSTRGQRTGLVAREIRTLVGRLRDASGDALAPDGDPPTIRGGWGRKPPRIVHIPGMVAARLYFNELMRIVLPSTQWWDDQMSGLLGPLSERTRDETAGEDGRRRLFDEEQIETLIAFYEHAFGRASLVLGLRDAVAPPYEFLKVIQLSAIVLRRRLGRAEDTAPHPVRLFAELYKDWPADPRHAPTQGVVWNVTRNRRARPAIRDSVRAMKADAGRRLFEISCRHLRCAVIDSGIDAGHPAFALPPEAEGKPPGSRVLATYDFAELRELLDPDFLRELRGLFGGDRAAAAGPPPAGGALARVHARFAGNDEGTDGAAGKAGYLDLVIRRIEAGMEIDWGTLEPLLRDPAPRRPDHPHGTQVAGILAADMSMAAPPARAGPHPAAMGDADVADRRARRDPAALPPLTGVCPDLRLYDMRVTTTDEEGWTSAQDFEVIAALKFVGHLNGRADEPAIHAANVSISIEHDVSRFACGRTPICEECERLVFSGVAVVAAAGNSGYADVPHVGARFYRTGSIADPGNADAVITVGATHRLKPHQYGVSYFSSRGPTGDGRRKPDLVAPGEKLHVPAPGGRIDVVDGTSFAAPHVTGAALLLMARHSELVGRPQRIKEVLCASATDLGREPYSQGAGMLDVLRALQSI